MVLQQASDRFTSFSGVGNGAAIELDRWMLASSITEEQMLHKPQDFASLMGP